MQRHAAHQGDADLGGETLASTGTEEGVRRAVVAGEVAHVLDDTGHPEVALAGHVGGACRHLLGGERRSGYHEHLGPRQHAGQAHLDVPGARGHVDEEVVELSPPHVLEELLDRPVQDETAPHDGGLLVGQEPHGHHFEQSRSHGLSRGTIFLLSALSSPCIPSRRGTENPQMSASSTPTVSPRWARATARLTVTEDLPTPPLPEATARTRAVSGMSVTAPGPPAPAPGPVHERTALGGVHLPHDDLDPTHAREAPDAGLDVVLIWVRRGQPGHGQGHLDLDLPVGVHAQGPDHAQIDDVVAQLGVDHPQQRGADRLLGWGRGRRGHSADPIAHLVLSGPTGATWVGLGAGSVTASDKVICEARGPRTLVGRPQGPRPEEAAR